MLLPPSSRNLIVRLGILAWAVFTVSGCRSMPESMDSAWRHFDPVGHRRYHREGYYPNERRMGLRLPKDLEAED
jgi:hypothetical protein